MGLRSSWEASETNRRCWAAAVSSRSSMVFMVWARRPTSSSVGGWGSRRCSVDAVMRSASARMASTGRSARPTSTHAITPTSATRAGNPTANRSVRASTLRST